MKSPRAEKRQGHAVYGERALGCQMEKRQDAPAHESTHPERLMPPSGRPDAPRTSRPFKPRGGRSRRPDRAPAPDDDTVRLYGVHAVEAALRNPKRTVHRLLLTENAQARLAGALSERQIASERASPRELDRILGPDTVHQGALLEAEPLPEPELAELADAATPGPLVVLDHVTDPHNVGAILRTCAVFGARGLIMTRRHSPPLDGTLAKSASGALELVPVALVQNLARAMAELKELAFLTLGLDGEAETLLEDETFEGNVALVLGAEGKGLRELTRTSCDRLCRVATAGPIASLNVSNAAAIALHHAAWRTRAR
jgi:23S rRNA (guanosine2251-2'-O)-methyltransferase